MKKDYTNYLTKFTSGLTNLLREQENENRINAGSNSKIRILFNKIKNLNGLFFILYAIFFITLGLLLNYVGKMDISKWEIPFFSSLSVFGVGVLNIDLNRYNKKFEKNREIKKELYKLNQNFIEELKKYNFALYFPQISVFTNYKGQNYIFIYHYLKYIHYIYFFCKLHDYKLFCNKEKKYVNIVEFEKNIHILKQLTIELNKKTYDENETFFINSILAKMNLSKSKKIIIPFCFQCANKL